MQEARREHGLIDVLDRVLDKGIVIDAHVRVSVAGVELISVDARVVVASIETHLSHADAIRGYGARRPAGDDRRRRTGRPRRRTGRTIIPQLSVG